MKSLFSLNATTCGTILSSVLLLTNDINGSLAGPIDGMKCNDGTVLNGSTGPERTIDPTWFCKFFPKHPWQYPPLGYGAKPEDKGVQFPYVCDRILGGTVYSVAGKTPCPTKTPEQVNEGCMTSPYTKEIIRDMACAVLKDPKKLGRFLNNKNTTRNKIEFAAFMAHVGQETGDMQTIWENFGNSGQYCSYFYPGEDSYCQTSLFYGRGVHQLTHPSNYADFSEYFFKDRTVLLKNPEKIIQDMEVSWSSAIWFWMEPRQHHNGDDSCAKWSLQHDALFSGLGFGETISTINGGIECSGGNDIGPWQRVSRFIYFMDVMGVPLPWVTGNLVTLPPFITEGCSWINKMDMKVYRTTWKDLESGSDCKGWNQPYPCGWGGLTTGPSTVPNPLMTAKGTITKAPLCPVPWDKKPDPNAWPYNIAQDEGYLDANSGGGGPPVVEDKCFDLKMCYQRCKNVLESGLN